MPSNIAAELSQLDHFVKPVSHLFFPTTTDTPLGCNNQLHIE